MIIQVQDIIKAGATFPINQNGNHYELILATGRIEVRNSSPKFGGQFNLLPVGIQPTVPPFTKLELKNKESFQVAFQILISDQPFKNNNVNISLAQGILVTVATQPDLSAGIPRFLIPDLSGTIIADLNGNKWLALSRAYFLVTNDNTGHSLLIQRFAASSNVTDAIDLVPENQTHRIDGGGDFSVSQKGGGNISGIASEFYNCLPLV